MKQAARALVSVAAMVCALTQHPVPASAQGTGRGIHIDPSARAAGMGGASTAVFWSGDPNDWANPALLGYGNGLSYRWSRTGLDAGLAGDVVFNAHRFNYRWGGLGLSAGRLTLDYGNIELSNGSGGTIGNFNPTEQIDAYGGGVSLAGMLTNIASLRGTDAPAITRYADVAFGFASKPVEINLAPASYQGNASTRAKDAGLLISVSPIPRKQAGGAFLDLAYGYAALNYNDASVTFPGEDITSYIARHYRNGFAARFGLAPSSESAMGLERRFGPIGEGMDPLLSISLAADFSHFQTGPDVGSVYDAHGFGMEIQLVNVLAFRLGHSTGGPWTTAGTTWGFGVGVPFGDIANVRYDYARDPKPDTIAFSTRPGNAPSHQDVWLSIDPLAIARR